MNLRPLRDNIVVRLVAAPIDKIGSLFVPEASQEQPKEAVVLAVGPGVYQRGVLCPNQVKVGDEVIFGKYSGHEIKIDGEEVIVLRDEDILGVLMPLNDGLVMCWSKAKVRGAQTPHDKSELEEMDTGRKN